MNLNNFRQTFAISFGVILIYLIMGVFFKHQIGVWFSVIWYLLGLGAIIFFAYNWIKGQNKGKKAEKVIDAEYRIR